MQKNLEKLIKIYSGKLDCIYKELAHLYTQIDSESKLKTYHELAKKISHVAERTYRMIGIIQSEYHYDGSFSCDKHCFGKNLEADREFMMNIIENERSKCKKIQSMNEIQILCRNVSLDRLNFWMKEPQMIESMYSKLSELGLVYCWFSDRMEQIKNLKSIHELAEKAVFTNHKIPEDTKFNTFDENSFSFNEVKFNGSIYNKLLDVFIDECKYLHATKVTDWSTKKIDKYVDELMKIFDIMEVSLKVDFNGLEFNVIALSLAEYSATTKKRFENLSLSPFDHKELERLAKSENSKYETTTEYIGLYLDETIKEINLKAINEAQILIARKGTDIMKRCFSSLQKLQNDPLWVTYSESNRFPRFIRLIDEFVNAYQTVIKLLDNFKNLKPKTLPLYVEHRELLKSNIESMMKTLESDKTLQKSKKKMSLLIEVQSLFRLCEKLPIRGLEMTNEDDVLFCKVIQAEHEDHKSILRRIQSSQPRENREIKSEKK